VPDLAQLARIEGLHVHLYGKQPKPARKIGHANITAVSAAELARSLRALEMLLAG
jgi:5-(carboxyamino)imidazole ribonucleotide synthase